MCIRLKDVENYVSLRIQSFLQLSNAYKIIGKAYYFEHMFELFFVALNTPFKLLQPQKTTIFRFLW